MTKIAVTVLAVALAVPAAISLAEEDNAIKKAMQFAHKAPKGEKKLNEKIEDGTASEEEVKHALELYKAMADAKPPRGDEAAFRDRVAKVVAATEELVAKKDTGVAHYKEAINCKACHSEHKPPQK